VPAQVVPGMVALRLASPRRAGPIHVPCRRG
jgi:hypothetical protein